MEGRTRAEQLGIPRWLAVYIGRILFFPTLLYNLMMYIFYPKKFKSWWNRIDDCVILSALPLPWQVRVLSGEGVKGVVNMCDEYEGPLKQYKQFKIQSLRLPLPDYFPPKLEDVIKGVEFINQYVSRKETVLVHCKAGRGRSTTIVLCYLVQRYGLEPEQAQRYISKIRPQVSTNVYRRRVVQQFVGHLNQLKKEGKLSEKYDTLENLAVKL